MLPAFAGKGGAAQRKERGGKRVQVENALKLSFYKELADVDERHGVKLVQHTVSGRFFVLKKLSVYDRRVFEYLTAHPVPGTPHIQELVEADECLYVVEEYISGITLKEYMEAHGPLSEAQAADWIRQICAILAPLHRQTPPIVHRDLKPGNLIVTPEGALVLVDFNAAKTVEGNRAQDTVLIGTVGYAAPEQYGFSASQPTADIYALGVLLNEMLCGHLPPEQMAGGRLEPVVRKCLQMDPANRYQTVQALTAQLTQALQPGGQARRPVGVPGRATAQAAAQAAAKNLRQRFSGAGFAGVPGWAPGHASAEAAAQKRRSPWPPGMRGTSLLGKLAGACWYLFVVVASASLVSHNADGTQVLGARLTFERFTFGTLVLVETFWLGNYRNIWQSTPLTSSKYLPVRILGAALWGFVLMILLLMGMSLVTAALFQ